MASFTNDYISRLQAVLGALDRADMDKGIEMVRTAWETERQVIVFGNGGSAMTALHFITDWNKMVFLTTGRPFRGRTLLDNMGMLTAYANDLSVADMFSHQMKNVARPGDLAIAISGSGNSENVLRAVSAAREMGCVTLGLCGFSGGRLKAAVDHAILAAVDDMQLAEDVHAMFGHVVMQSLCGKH